MKRNMIMKTSHQYVYRRANQRGHNLLEVLVAIAIFAIGMLALASLQGNLTRSASDANTRMVATNLAEGLIERRRGFARITDTDPNNDWPAYDDIVTESFNIIIPPYPDPSGMVYTVSSTVTDFYYDLANDNFSTTAPAGVLVSDYKLMQVTVSWVSPNMRLEDGVEVTGVSLGTGSITISESISSVTTASSSRVVTQKNDDLVPISITYTPGARPDIVSLSLGNTKFKESLTPEPKVFRVGEFVETRFDVITYSQPTAGALFVRHEEFATVSCECALKTPSGTPETSGRRPVVWAGDEYAPGHWVDKPYGVGTNSTQSILCDPCCRDHHDGGSSAEDQTDTAVNQLSPFRPTSEYFTSGAFNGDHKHYNRDDLGILTLADANNDVYVEACRLTRVDGFFKISQDFRQEDLHVFPGDFLDDEAEVITYSSYVTAAADDFENATYPDYETAPPCIGGPLPCVEEPVYGGAWPPELLAGEFPTWTQLPLGLEETQQLRSRGIYIDYVSYDLRTVIDCLRLGGPAESCQTGDVELDRNDSTNILELLPFFDVQLTLLNRWNEIPINTPVETTNEGLEDNNEHSRGLASRDAFGGSYVDSTGHKGNLVFTDTAATDNLYLANFSTATINVQSLNDGGGGGGTPLPGTDPVISGNLTETAAGVEATDIEVVGLLGPLCDRTPGGFVCTVPSHASTDGIVKVFGYGIKDVNLYACLTGNPLGRQSEVTLGKDAYAIFELYGTAAPNGSGYSINIQDTPCTL